MIADASSGGLGPLPDSALLATCPCIPGIPPSSCYSEEQPEHVTMKIWAEAGEINFFPFLLIFLPID